MQQNSTWKPSIYNTLIAYGDEHILYNSVTSQSLELTDAQRAVIEDVLGDPIRATSAGRSPLVEGLAALGFVVPYQTDELADQHNRYLGNQRGTTLFLTIAPTMSCNLHCTYCFQREIPATRVMTPAIQDGVVEFVERQLANHDAMVVQWFGGEPLVGYRAIRSLSDRFRQLCELSGVAFRSEMLTNGVLLTPEIIDDFPRLALSAIQIPLDGDAETYAARKQVSLQRAQGFYDFLLAHAQRIVDLTGSLVIRVNVDRDNANAGRQVVELFRAHGIVDRRIDFRLGFLNTSRDVIDCIPHDCYTATEFAEAEQEFRQYLKQEGFMVFGRPEQINHPCAAVIRSSFTIDPYGNIGKCTPSIGTRGGAYAKIHPGAIDRTFDEIAPNDEPFAAFDPFEIPMCRECELLPACLGSCPKMHWHESEHACSIKNGLAAKLAFYHQFSNG